MKMAMAMSAIAPLITKLVTNPVVSTIATTKTTKRKTKEEEEKREKRPHYEREGGRKRPMSSNSHARNSRRMI
jgi:hypothetical protein